jgi:predicted nucleic acid-binding Zn ribbon protein
MAAAPTPWATCATCGDAIPPAAANCPTCGQVAPDPKAVAAPSKKRVRRLQLHKGLRVSLVVVIAFGLAGVMALAIYQGPPVAADPLTGTWTYTMAPHNYSEFSGAVTGGDYISGNYTVVTPPGAVIVFEVFNSSSFAQFARGQPATPAQAPLNATSGLVDFVALVTDTYYFVWYDPYPPSSHIDLTLYASTEYMSNVDVGM